MRILVVDTLSIFRIGIRKVLGDLRPDSEVIEAESIDAAVAILRKDDAIDVVLVDLATPGMDEGAGLARLMARRKDLPIVVATADVDRLSAMRAVDWGAMGLIPKSVTGEEILEALETVLDGRLWLPRAALSRPATARDPTSGGMEAEQVERLLHLTRRQREVLALLIEGRSNADIARKLGLAEGTVRIHVSSILKSLNVSNRTQAAIIAAQFFTT